MNAKEVLEYAKKNNVVMVDLRFTDWPGMWQHCSFPISEVDEGTFEDGMGFDGSSIRGWQAINESDMLMVPDPSTAFIDPFLAQNVDNAIVRQDALGRFPVDQGSDSEPDGFRRPGLAVFVLADGGIEEVLHLDELLVAHQVPVGLLLERQSDVDAEAALAARALVGGQHELLDDSVSDVPFRTHDGLRAPGEVQNDVRFGQIEVDTAPAAAAFV